MKIVFATNNKNKLKEIREILGDRVEVLSLKDIGCDVDIPETGATLEENALQKAQYIYDHYHMNVFADDTGLEVEALNGAPGIYSARYASMETVETSNASSTSSASNPSWKKKENPRLFSLRESLKVRLSVNVGEGRASATILSSSPQATTKLLPNWAYLSRIRYPTGHEPLTS